MINNRLGFSFPIILVVGGGLLTIAGIISSIENPLIGVPLIIVGIFFWSSSYGFQIDGSQEQFREYGSMFGIKKGKWYPLEYVPYISVLKSRIGMRIYSASSYSTTKMDDSYQVCLLNKTHRKKVVVKEFENREQAIRYAEKISSQFNKPVVTYSPVLSKKTRKRRSRNKP